MSSNNNKSNAEWIRDYWYNLSDYMSELLPEHKRVELEHFIRDKDQAHKAEVEEAVRKERKRCVDIVNDYREQMFILQLKMMGNAHKDSKIFLSYDMHSRLIAVKHIQEKLKLTNPLPESDKQNSTQEDNGFTASLDESGLVEGIMPLNTPDRPINQKRE